MKRYIFVISFLLINFSFLNAQTIQDALRYSTYEFGATGRALGTGNSFAALGTDVSLIGSNPAGLASFRRSEFTLTPGYDIINANATLNNSSDPSVDETESRWSFGNISYVAVSLPRSRNWRTFNFGLSYNRLATFRQNTLVEGSSPGSILERWTELAEGFFPGELSPFEAGLAYDALALINVTDGSGEPTNEYLNDYSLNQGGRASLNKSYLRDITGGLSEFSISLASNYRDKLYIGGLIGIPFVNYNETRTYNEIDEGDQIAVFDDLEYVENISTVGAGINLKIGAIYRLSQSVRLGLAIHTPTRLNLEDNWNNTIAYNFTLPDLSPISEQDSGPGGPFEYSLRTPARYIANAGYIINKTGFVSAEVEYVDYRKATFDFSDSGDTQYQEELNGEISNTNKGAINIRLGGEYAYQKLRARAGVSILGSSSDELEPVLNYHAGLGLRARSFFMDLGYRLGTNSSDLIIYQTRNLGAQSAETKNFQNNLILTIGFKL